MTQVTKSPELVGTNTTKQLTKKPDKEKTKRERTAMRTKTLEN